MGLLDYAGARLGVTAEGYCMLCRQDLPRSAFDDSGLEDWAYDLVGVIKITVAAGAAGPSPEPYLFRTNLNDEPTLLHSSTLTLRRVNKEDQALRVTLYKKLSASIEKYPLRPVFFAHVCCWKLAREHYGLSPLGLYKLGRQTQPILPRCILTQPRHPHISPPVNREVFSRGTQLGRLLGQFFTVLPLELQQEVFGYLPTNLAICLAAAAQTCAYLDFVKRKSAPNKTTQFALQKNNCTSLVNWLSASMVNIFGQTYLHRVSHVVDEHPTPYSKILVKFDPLLGADFVLGTHGLRAFRLSYRDGSTTSWLGNPSEGVHGTVRGASLWDLRFLVDDLKVIRLSFDTMIEQRSLGQPTAAVWNIKPELVRNNSSSLRISDVLALTIKAFFLNCNTRYTGHLLHHPGLRLCQYLPLQYDISEPLGINVYCYNGGVAGIFVHGKSPCQAGQRLGHPLYFQFRPNKHLAALYMCASTRNFHLHGPFLMLTTNLGRSAAFCPWALVHHCPGDWTPLSTNKERITGLIFDPLTIYRSCLQSIGVSVRPAAGPLVGSAPIEKPLVFDERTDDFISECPSTYLTRATLANVAKLQVRKVGRRCDGLCIHHGNGLVEVLGKWDPSDGNAIIDIYERSEGPLTTLTFVYDKSEPRIADIVVGNRPEEYHTFAWHASKPGRECPIVWQFSQYYDHLSYGRGWFDRLNVSESLRETTSLGC